MTETSGIEWVAAVLSPWTISPHPNFSNDVVSPAARLALVTECRVDEIEKYSFDTSAPSWQDELIQAASRSIVMGSQDEASNDLWRLSTDKRLPFGARVAAANYAALAWTELDRLDDATAEYMTSLNLEPWLTNSGPEITDPTHRVVASTALLQLAFRAEEAHNVELWDAARNACVRALQNTAAIDVVDFRTSNGISWSAGQVQRDIIAALRARARASKSRREFPYGNTWQSVVRSRRGWIQGRVDRSLEGAFQEAVNRRFEFDFASERRSRTIGFSRDYHREYSSLLVAELGADFDAARAARVAQAQRHLYDYRDQRVLEAVWLQQSLRLLRQATATNFLKDALAYLRTGGPLDAIRGDAQAILSRARRGNYLSTEDLLVLGGAGDLLGEDDARDAVLTVLALDTDTDRWSELNERWTALETLAPGAGLDVEIATAALRIASDERAFNSVVGGSISRVLAELNWDRIPPELKSSWAAFLTGAEDDADYRSLQETIGTHVGLQVGPPVASGVTRAALLVDGIALGDAEALAQAQDAIETAMAEDLTRAEHGSAAFGGIDTGNLAAAFAVKYDSARIWRRLTDYLISPKLNADLKERALSRLAEQSDRVPAEVRHELQRHQSMLLRPPMSSSMFRSESLPVRPSALRAIASLDLAAAESIREAIYELQGASEHGRVEAAKSLAFCFQACGQIWTTATLLSLARDSSPLVRAEAGFALTQASTSDLDDDRFSLLQAMLTGDGVRIPLRIAHGLQRLQYRGLSVPDALEDAVLAARTRSRQSRIVSGALDLLDSEASAN